MNVTYWYTGAGNIGNLEAFQFKFNGNGFHWTFRWPGILYFKIIKAGMQFTQPAATCSIGSWTQRFTRLPGLTTRERFKNLMTGFAPKTTASNILLNFDGLKASGALPAG